MRASVAALLGLSILLMGCGKASDSTDAQRETPSEINFERDLRRDILVKEEALDPVPVAARPTSDQGLEGTVWQAGEITFRFQKGGNVLVQGGEVAKISPTGIPARYTIKEGRVEIDLSGRITTGNWNGSELYIGGHRAVRVKSDESRAPH